MAELEYVVSCVPPGTQPVLFHVASDEVPTFVVIDRDGRERLRTASLGVAVTAARRVLIDQGEVWLRASDHTCAHLDQWRVATETPESPWIRTVAATLEGATNDHQ